MNKIVYRAIGGQLVISVDGGVMVARKSLFAFFRGGRRAV